MGRARSNSSVILAALTVWAATGTTYEFVVTPSQSAWRSRQLALKSPSQLARLHNCCCRFSVVVVGGIDHNHLLRLPPQEAFPIDAGVAYRPHKHIGTSSRGGRRGVEHTLFFDETLLARLSMAPLARRSG